MAQANPRVIAVVNSTDPADKPYRYESPDNPTRCSAPIFVAKIDAPITGHFIDRPPRKKFELFCPAFLRKAIYIPKERLPIITVEKTTQSKKVNERLMMLMYCETAYIFDSDSTSAKLKIHKNFVQSLNTLYHRPDGMIINLP